MSKRELFKLGADTNDNATVWRYIPDAVFEDLIQSSSVYFCRMKYLDDKREGTHSAGFIEACKQIPIQLHGIGSVEEIRNMIVEEHEKQSLSYYIQCYSCVNCWHEAEHEAEHMWKDFVAPPLMGVALKSTVKKLKNTFENRSDYEIGVRKIVYKDYSFPDVSQQTEPFPMFCVDKEHVSQSEIRVLLWDTSCDNQSRTTLSKLPKGIKVSVELLDYVDSITICPGATAEYKEKVHNIVRNIGLPVYQSKFIT